ncbi:MAG TPA: 4Fe-4S dicluster domain-containing protein [Gemmatimonadales bacterium]|nr:4Fe-4S dicluster domain-containing protein [Gemmatimonadales bacterium]
MFNSGDRRDLLKQATEKWLGSLMEQAEERIIRRHFVRPPGALPEVGFLAACTRCNACVEACPPRAIRTAPSSEGFAAGTPHLEVELQPCISCPDMPCAAACPTGALVRPAEGWKGYKLHVLELVPERCVTFSGVTCGACAEACPVGATALSMDGDGHPVIKAEGCTGCGVCVRACITSPSSFKLHPVER